VYATTAQAIFRVARSDDIDGAEIFVHTAAIPNWIPVEYVSDEKIRVRTDEEHMSIQAVEELEVATTAEIADMVDHGERCVRKHLNNLAREGYVEKREERGKAVWRDAGLEEVCWWGEVDLPEYLSLQR
jgi:predicted HTH transcriptional regulator